MRKIILATLSAAAIVSTGLLMSTRADALVRAPTDLGSAAQAATSIENVHYWHHRRHHRIVVIVHRRHYAHRHHRRIIFVRRHHHPHFYASVYRCRYC